MDNITLAQRIMAEFGEKTGLLPTSEKRPRRYLWTDSFAVCNYLALHQLSGRDEALELAVRLVNQVHEVLGRHRTDDRRKGWLSNLDNEERRLHPTAGGLRIGKNLPEREPGESVDESLEWERDGQYYHYLTKWMHALCCTGSVIGDPQYILWAAELALRSHTAFSYRTADGSKGLYWKMSIDLSRPLVSSMGHHDPLDGMITYVQISRLCSLFGMGDCPVLTDQTADLANMCRGVNWATADPLGLGTLLADTWRLVQLQQLSVDFPLPHLLSDMLEASIFGLSHYTRENIMDQPAGYRLAFRELGLAIGLQAVHHMVAFILHNPHLFRTTAVSVHSLLENLKQYLPLQEQILQFWLKKENQQFSNWTEHADINMVMLATCLVPDGFLDLRAAIGKAEE